MTALGIADTPRRPKVRALSPSSIQTICQEFRAIRDMERARMLARRDTLKLINEQMPEPHPSIVHGDATAADGICADVWVHEIPHNAVRPALIEEALRKIKPLSALLTKPSPNVHVIKYLEEPLPLTDLEIDKQARLQARLELSQAYFAEQKRRLEAAGAVDREDADNDNEADRLEKLERKLIKLKARTADDLLAKIELFNLDPQFFEPSYGDGLVGSILEDTAAFLKASRGH